MRDRLGRLLARWRIRVVLPHVRGSLLDIGCGENRLVAAYGSGVGVDVFPWTGADMVICDTARLPFPDSSFDTVAFLACLNHIPDRRAVLREARRVLKPGGRIIVTMIPPALSSVWHLLRRPWESDQRERGMGEGEVYGLTRRETRRLLEECGFAVDAQRAFMCFMNTITLAHAS